jgi:hypothetical protein
MSVLIERIVRKNLKRYINETEIKPSESAVKNICDAEKFCSAQGKITFGQLRALVETATTKRLYKHIGEGGYKAILRLLPWFLPQLSIAGFTGSIIRAANNILRPTLEETTNYGLLTLMDDRFKVKFARYISELASEMPDDQEVPEYFVENELRHWLNEKFLLDPPLPPKTN